jgi:hypothetical protein
VLPENMAFRSCKRINRKKKELFCSFNVFIFLFDIVMWDNAFQWALSGFTLYIIGIAQALADVSFFFFFFFFWS